MTIERSTGRGRAAALRTGLVLAGVLGVLDIGAGVVQFSGAGLFPAAIAILIIALGIATVVLVPFAWRGRRAAAWTVAVLRLVSAMTGLPAFFVPGVPLPAIIAASTGIVLAVAVAVLIAVGQERRS